MGSCLNPLILFKNQTGFLYLLRIKSCRALYKRMFEKSNLLLTGRLEFAATRNFTHRPGLKTLDFLLVHGGGLRLCSSVRVSVPEALFYSPNTFQTSSKEVNSGNCI
jgi:hypothetical protein